MSEAEARRRHHIEKAKEDGSSDLREQPVTAAPGEGEDEEGEWGIDDEGWDSTYSTSELARKRRVMKRTNGEVGIAFVCHLALMCYYIYVHVYDATIVKRSKGVGFDFSYGGRWKFLTYINMWVQFVFFFLCFFTDIMPRSYWKVKFQQACDLIFTTVAVPLSFSVFFLFWSIYAIDREYIYPKRLDETIPFILNHYWHTGIAVTSLIEAIFVFHRYPSNFKAFFVQFLVATLYIVWMVWQLTVTGKWPYPFLKALPLPLFPVFCLVCLLLDYGFYFIGKFVCYIRWRERHQLMYEMRPQ